MIWYALAAIAGAGAVWLAQFIIARIGPPDVLVERIVDIRDMAKRGDQLALNIYTKGNHTPPVLFTSVPPPQGGIIQTWHTRPSDPVRRFNVS